MFHNIDVIPQVANKPAPDLNYDFNRSDTVWSDFLKTNLHPRSFCLLNDLVSAGDTNSIDLYSNGEEMYMKEGKEQIEEALRRLSEDCDYLQGFHLIFDSYNAFAGVSSQILQYLDDEYKRVPSLCFPVYQDNKDTPIDDTKVQMHRLYAALNSMNSMNSYSTFFSPLSFSNDIVKLSQPFISFPHLQYDRNLMYHTSAVLAAAIETLTSAYRLRSMKFSMWDITSAMSTYGRKLVSSSTSLPFPLAENTYLNAMVQGDHPDYYMTSLTPFYKPKTEKTLFQSAVLRGIPVNKFQNLGKSIYHTVKTRRNIWRVTLINTHPVL
ncbi:hypothetical protein JTE90_005176 [Oedothorax gibbosus]|uniref:DML1/Misato tubulin domain-containing protein n=1 Tax=Oedothorax gibbosus TaxID=931172 RepID=A0AAV6TGR5_9ARAC|nr:hypothetical protein JTE90_005176 [Oedothorax gibbosus]